MIKLYKGDKPQLLIDNAFKWTKEITDRVANGERLTTTEATRYRHHDIKEALVKETKNKCAYCESKLQHIHHGDVEHINPKSLAPELTIEWENLTLACEICNQNKTNLDPYANSIIDPYHIDPRLHILFVGPLAFATGSVLGISTRTIFDLDRPELVEARKERFIYVMSLYSNVLREDIPLHARRLIYKDLVSKEGSSDKAFSAMTLDLIEFMKRRVPSEVQA